MIHIKEENSWECCGCTACASVCPERCINMKADGEGFLYPQVDTERCADCGACDRVCPVAHRPPLGTRAQAFVIRAKDPAVLMDSSSGGFFTPLALHVLSKEGVVFGAAFHNDFRVVHKQAATAGESAAFRGSKYVQSELGDTFLQVKDLLARGRNVLFSGTPCQVAGLKNFLGKDCENLYCVDLICHGVPSPALWEAYRNDMQKRFGASIKSVNFRKKTYGYHSGTMEIIFANGKRYTGSARVDEMLKPFFSEISARPSCYRCAFKTVEREADISLFDCWHAEDLVDGLKDDDKGYTNVLVHSDNGMELLQNMEADIECYPADANRAVALDGSMAQASAIPHPQRNIFYKLLAAEGLSATVRRLLPVRSSDRLIEKSKNVLYRSNLIGLARKAKACLTRGSNT